VVREKLNALAIPERLEEVHRRALQMTSRELHTAWDLVRRLCQFDVI
jgi:hypothetical protein